MRITKDSLLGQERLPELADKERIDDSPSSSEMEFCARRIGATMIKLGSVRIRGWGLFSNDKQRRLYCKLVPVGL